MTRRTGRSAPGPLPRVLVLAGAALWGTTGTTQQALAPVEATSASVGSVRLILGALALAAVAGALGGLGDLRGFARAGQRGALAAGAAAMAAYQVTFFAGVARTGVAVGTIVALGSAPAFAGVLGVVIRRERPERWWGLATALAITGCVLLVGAGRDADVHAGGVALALGAGAAYATFAVASKHLLDAGRDPSGTMAVTFGGGAVLLLPVLVAGDLSWVLEPRGAAAAVWLGVGTVGLAYLLFAIGLRALPVATAATLTLAEPLTAAALGLALLGERPGPLATLGTALLAAGLVVLSIERIGSRRPDPDQEDPRAPRPRRKT